MKRRTQEMLAARTSDLTIWVKKCWDEGLALGRDLVENATNPLYDKMDFDDALVDLVAADWLVRGFNPEPSISQIAFASLTYGNLAAGAYPTHFGYSPIRTCVAYADWRKQLELQGDGK